jgi:hypothetical protein
MKKLAIIYNTCGIYSKSDPGPHRQFRGEDYNLNFYIKAINSILQQNYTDYELIVSSLVATNELHPVNVTFNNTARKATEHFGPFTDYMYYSSDVTFIKNNDLSNLYNLHSSGPYGITCPRPTNDSGVFSIFGIGKPPVFGEKDESAQNILFQNGDLIIPIGKSWNCHLAIFNSKIFKNMNEKIIPDIFASYCTESTFSYLTACLQQKFIISKDVIIDHEADLDGNSAGFKPQKTKYKDAPWQHLYRSPKTMIEILSNPEAFESGFGYEEINNIFPHNRNMYDAEGNHKDPTRLLNFIKDNIYLNEKSLNYDKIKCQTFWRD